MTRLPHALLVASVLFALFLLSACRRSDDTIATLERVNGGAERDFRATVNRWEKADAGARFTLGDGVRTAPTSTAVVRLFDRSELVLQPKTVVRFLDQPSGPKGAKLDVEMGEATFAAGDQAVDVGLELGSAHIEAHGKIRLVAAGTKTRLEVMIGNARILTQKESFDLQVGDAVDIEPTVGIKRDTAPLANVAPSTSAPPSEAPSADSTADAGDAGDAGPEEAVLSPESAGARSRGPDRVDFLAAAGDSFAVHDPKPPTAIGFSQSGCPGGSILTLDGGRRGGRETVGSARVSAEFASGSHRYVVSCLEANGAKGKEVAQGSISVFADAGLRRLARTAPLTSVDTDGRRYTVLYQTLLPKVSVRWPNAPTATSFVLSVRSPQGTKTFSSKAASYLFAPGALAEGEHVLAFEGDGKRSKPTSIMIRFDNAAPTASLSSPADGSFASGASVLVAGSALPGWSVSAGGRELTQDDQNRFSAQVSAPAAERALVIRFSQAGRGVHYYLRRSAR
jgi:hypothetical protein